MIQRTVRGAWLVACGAVLAWFFLSEAKDIYIPVGYALLLLTFPIGLVAMGAFGGLVWALHRWFAYDSPSALTVLLWLTMMAAGYWQWFHLGPRLVQRLRRAA